MRSERECQPVQGARGKDEMSVDLIEYDWDSEAESAHSAVNYKRPLEIEIEVIG